MRHNAIKAKFVAGEPAFGCSIMIPSPQIVEMVGHAGFDWVLIDIIQMLGGEARDFIGQCKELTGPAVTDAEIVETKAAEDIIDATIVAPPQTNADFLSWAIAAAVADDHLNDHERAMVENAARLRGVPPDRLEIMIDVAQRRDRAESRWPRGVRCAIFRWNFLHPTPNRRHPTCRCRLLARQNTRFADWGSAGRAGGSPCVP